MTKSRLLTIGFYAIAGLLRLVNLGGAALWYDEAFSYLITSSNWDGMWQTIAGDVHPPLYYLVLDPITNMIGLNEFWLRLPSVFFSLVGIYLTGEIGRELGLPTRARWVAMVLVALLPSELYYAQEARMYALMQMLVLFWLLATLQRKWLYAGIYATLTLYTHNYGIFYLVIMGLVGLGGEWMRPVILDPDNHDYPWLNIWKRGDEANFRGAFLAAAVPVLLFVPWVVTVLLGQMGHVASNYWIAPISWGQIAYHLYMLYFVNFTADIPTMSAIMVFSLTFWSIYRSRQSMSQRQWLVVMAVGVGPMLLAIAASLVWKPILTYRYLLPSLPMICLLIGVTVAAIEPWKAAYVGTLVLPILTGGIWAYYDKMPLSKGLTRQYVEMLREVWRPGDQVVHTNSSSYLLWRAYAPDLPNVLLPMCDERNHGEINTITRAGLGIPDTQDPNAHKWLVIDLTPLSTNCEIDRINELTQKKPPKMQLYSGTYTYVGIYEMTP